MEKAAGEAELTEKTEEVEIMEVPDAVAHGFDLVGAIPVRLIVL